MKFSKKLLSLCSILALFSMAAYAVPAQTIKEAIRMTESERYEVASAAFKNLLKSGDDMGGDLWFYYGDNFLQWGVLDSAKIMFQKGADAKPSNPLNFVGLGSVAWTEGNADLAKQDFYKATSLTTTQGKDLAKDKQSMVYLKMAQAYLQGNVKNLADAFTYINNAIKIDPKNPDAYILLGDYWVEKNITDVSEAIKNYEKATDLDKNSSKAYLRQGQMWVRVQNYDEGLKAYNKAISMDSTFAPGYRFRGDLYFLAGRYPKAIDDYKKYLLLNDSRTAREKYAKAVFLTKDYKTAIKEIKEVQMRDSSNLILYRLIGYSYYEIGDYPQGLLYMEKFMNRQKIKDKPKLIAQDRAYYGKLLWKNGKDSLAILEIQKGMAMDDNYIMDGYGDIANIYFKAKRYKDAAKFYELKIQLEMADKKGTKIPVGDYNSLGQAYYFNKDYIKADTAFAKITDAYPVFGNAWRGRCNSKQDDADKPAGKAKPFYELAIQKAGTDIDRNKKDLIEAYSYLGFYYLTQKSFDCSKAAWLKVIELDPENEKAKKALESKELKPVAGTCDLFKKN